MKVRTFHVASMHEAIRSIGDPGAGRRHFIHEAGAVRDNGSACWGLCAGSHGGDRGRRSRAGRSTDLADAERRPVSLSAPAVPAEESRFQKRFRRNGAEGPTTRFRESPTPTAPRQAKTARVASAPRARRRQHHAQGTAFQSFQRVYEGSPRAGRRTCDG